MSIPIGLGLGLPAVFVADFYVRAVVNTGRFRAAPGARSPAGRAWVPATIDRTPPILCVPTVAAPMSTATKIVLGTVVLSALGALALIVNTALAG